MTSKPDNQALPDQATPRLAIIGAGQLGMMLWQAAERLGVKTVIVAPGAHDPAINFADTAIVADLTSEGLAERIAEISDVVTFEFEAVPEPLLEGLAEQQQLGKLDVRPAVATLQMIKNKGKQKQWLKDNAIPTLPFRLSDSPLQEQDALIAEFGVPFVQKAATGGYDGYGVQIVRTEADLAGLWDTPSMIEAFADEPLELGVVVARSASGETVSFAPVRMTFKAENVLDAVVSPTGLGAAQDAAAVALATDVVQKLGTVGVFAVEMFVMPDGQLVVNEISPRVHNSGHHTIEATPVSQFEQHVRAVCDLPLRDPGSEPPAAVMRNLLYSDALEFLLEYPAGPVASSQSGVFLHWYGKREARKGRKMGHITCLCSDPADAEKRVADFLAMLRQPQTGATA